MSIGAGESGSGRRVRWALVACAGMGALGFVPRAWTDEGRIVLPVRDARTHDMLRQRAASDDPADRLEAVSALGLIADPADTALLRRLLRDADPRVRAEAVASLGYAGAPGLADEADRLLSDDQSAVRAAFFRSIASDQVRSGWIRQGLADGAEHVRAAAAQCAPCPGMEAALFERIREDPSIHVRVAAWERLVEGEGDARREALHQALSMRGSELFIRALYALRAGDRVDASLIGEVLTGTRGAELAAAVSAVGRARVEAAIPTLLGHMESYDALARRLSCEALARFDLPGVVPMLGRRLAHDPDAAVARAAARALTVHSSAAADAALLAVLQSDRPVVLVWTLDALGHRGTHAGARAAVPLLTHADRDTRTAAMIAIRRIDPAVARARTDALREAAGGQWPRETPAALRLLTAMGYRGHVDLMRERLVRITHFMPHEVRLASLEGLIALGVGDLTERCIRIVADTVVPPPPGENGLWDYDNDAVRVMALRYLSQFGSPADQPHVIRAFEETPPYPVRAALAKLVTQWSGTMHEPIPSTTHVRYSIESLDPPAYEPRVPPPGIRAR